MTYDGVTWMSACSTGACVEVARVPCSSGGCVDVSREADRVLVRDSKLGEESPVIEFTPSGWRGFVAVAVEWDRTSTVLISGVSLNAGASGEEHAVCVLDDSLRHLHFTWEEWDTFVQGVKDRRFDLEGAPK